MPNSVTYYNWTSIFERDVAEWSTKTDIKKRFDYRLKYDKHSKLNSGHNWDDLYDHFMTMRIFTLIMNQDIHMSSENCEESDYGLDLDLQTISY